ncbi:MAG: hypothetical protein M2R45_01204 [Verrucomicrobia subdivision 3 bacterium]|nr:hypothetical protein [Limisphaerales bacterium]MCS1415244.1 hypothetical protein [Limisphaerales bacterium]
MFQRSIVTLVLLAALGAVSTLSTADADSSWHGVRILPDKGKLRIEINGEFFSNYIYEDVTRPFLHPVIGPAKLPVTRNWPMGFKEGEAKDHPHHRSFWYAHGEINGYDFWSESDQAGTTQHIYFKEITSGPDFGKIVSLNELVAKDGSVVGTDTREITIHNRPSSERVIDFNITIHASHGGLVLGDTKEGSMAIRLAPTMRLKGAVGQGHIINSEGQSDDETWGKRAKWVDYYGPVQDQTVGVAIFDHPENPRHPTWWHVRNYGLFAANPFGIHDFERKRKGVGDYPVTEGANVTWKYRFFMHLGDERAADVATRYDEFARTR